MLWPLFSVDQMWALARPAMLSGGALMLALVLVLLAITYRLRLLLPAAGAAAFTALLPLALHPELLPIHFLAEPIAAWLASLGVLAPLVLLAVFIAMQLPANRRADAAVVLLGLVFLLPIIWLVLTPFLLGLRVFNGALLLGVWLPTLLAITLFMPHWRNTPTRPLLIAAALCLITAATMLYLAMALIWVDPFSETLYLLAHITAILCLAAAPIHTFIRHLQSQRKAEN